MGGSHKSYHFLRDLRDKYTRSDYFFRDKLAFLHFADVERDLLCAVPADRQVSFELGIFSVSWTNPKNTKPCESLVRVCSAKSLIMPGSFENHAVQPSRLVLVDIRCSSSSMPKAQHENGIRIANQLINNPIRSVNDLANRWIAHFKNNLSHLRKCSDGECLVDKGIAKPASTVGTVSCNVRNNLPQIILGLRGENYWPAHVSTSLRASSAGRPSPRRVCSRAVLMPARSSISRAISSSEVSSGSLERRSITISLLLMVINISDAGADDKFREAATSFLAPALNSHDIGLKVRSVSAERIPSSPS